MNKKARMKGGILLSFCLVFLCSITGALCGLFGGNNANAMTDTDTVSVYGGADIYDAAKGAFNKNGMQELLTALGKGAGSATDTKSYKALESAYSAPVNASTLSSANGGDLVVLFGGYKWTVTYLSTTTSGDLIATLWYADTETTSMFADNWYNTNTSAAGYGCNDDLYSNNYGRSLVRSFGLNIGSDYYSPKSGSGAMTGNTTNIVPNQSAAQSASHQFALFTMANSDKGIGVVDYLATPAEVTWQGSEVGKAAAVSYRCPNDSYEVFSTTASPTKEEWYSRYQSKDFQTRDGYSEWKDDPIWLPSLYETGNQNANTGLWNPSENQRKSAHTGGNGTRSWLRSGTYNSANYSYILTETGAHGGKDTNGSYGVRPALHLNLKSAESSLIDDGSQDTNPNVTMDGTQAHPFILWGDTENKAHIWARAVSAAQDTTDRVYVKLQSDWIATENEALTTSFAGNLGYNLAAAANYAVNTRAINTPFFHGAICVPENVKMAIDLNGHTIDRNLDEDNGVYLYNWAIYATYYSDLEINDSTAVGSGKNQTYAGDGKITGAIADLLNGASVVGGAIRTAYATVTLNGGQICNNGGSAGGGGAGIYAENSTIIMNGGSVHDNTGFGPSGANGAGIFIRGYGSLTMNGGEIYNNSCLHNGAGVMIWGDTATFEMNGGKIHDNTASAGGGGVCINQSKGAVINDGEIYGNTAATQGGALYLLSTAVLSASDIRSSTVINGGKFYKNIANSGGGIIIANNYTDLVINGGEFYENTGKSLTTTTTWGALIRVCQWSTLKITDGKFYDNTYEGPCQSGIRCDMNTRLEISGGEFFGNKTFYHFIHTQEYFKLTGGQIYGNFVEGNGNDSTAAVMAAGNNTYAYCYLSGEPYVGFKKNDDGTVTEASNYNGTTAPANSKQEGKGGLYTSGASKANLYTNCQFMPFTIDGEFTGKVSIKVWENGIFTNGWGKWNSDITAENLSDYVTCDYAPNHRIELKDGELTYLRGTNTKDTYAALPTFAGGYNDDQYYVSENGGFTAELKIDANCSFTVSHAAGGEASPLTAGTDYTVTKDGAVTKITVNNFGKYIVSITPDTGYDWINTKVDATDRSPKTLNFFVRKEVSLPKQGNLNTGDTWVRYDGSEHVYPYLVGDGANITRYLHYTVVVGGTNGLLTVENDGSLTIDKTNKNVKLTQRGRYNLYFNLDNTDEYVWADGTTAEKNIYFYCLTVIEAPEFDGSVQTLTVTQAEAAAGVSVTSYSDNVLRPWQITPTLNGESLGTLNLTKGTPAVWGDGTLTVDLDNGLITATQPGTYVITFGRGNGYTEYLWNKGANTSNQTLTLYVKDSVDGTPKWADKTTANKRYDIDSGSHTVNFIMPSSGVTVTCENENGVLDAANGTLTVSQPGTYTLVFTLDDPVGTAWPDGDKGDTKTLTVYIARIIQPIAWADGATATTRYFGYSGINTLLFKLPEGVNVICSNPVGINYDEATGEIYALRRGTFEFTFSPKEGYVWNNNNSDELIYAANVVSYVDYPMWFDGTTGDKPLPYNNGEQTVTINSPGSRALSYDLTAYDGTSARFTISSFPHVNTWKGITVKVEVSGDNTLLTVSKPAQYTLGFLPIDSFAIWEGTSSIAQPRNLTVFVTGNTIVQVPTWPNGDTVLYAEYTGSPYTFDLGELPEGLVISKIAYGGTDGYLDGTGLTLVKFSTGTVYFKLSDPSIYKWADGTNPNGEKTLGFYFRKKIATPEWGSELGGGTDKITLTKGGEKTITILAPKVAAVTCNNENVVMTTTSYNDDLNKITIKASEVGNYTFTFKNPNGAWYYWEADGIKTLSGTTIDKTLSFSIVGATEVDVPKWDDGSTTKNFPNAGSGTLTFTVDVPLNATLLDEISNNSGRNGTLVGVTDGVATIEVYEAGVYTLKFVIDTDNYVWAGGSINNVMELKAAVTNRLAVPTWTDKSTDTQYVTFNTSGGNTIDFVMPENVAVSVNNRNGSVSGNTLTVTEPGQYVLTFNFINNKLSYAWDDGVYTAGASKTLTVNFTGGTKVAVPTWEDGTTDKIFKTYSAGGVSVTTYVLPEGVTVTVAGRAETPTVSYVNVTGGRKAVISATLAGDYFVYFTIDTAEYAWADNSLAERKNLDFTITSKEIVNYPSWSDDSLGAKYITSTGGSVSATLKYSAADVDVAITDADGATVGSVSGMNITVPGAGTYTVTFSLKDPANKSWQNNATATRTLTLYVTEYIDIPEWNGDYSGTNALFFAYDAAGHTVGFDADSNLLITLGYKDTNGINRVMTSSDGVTWTATFNGKTVTATISNGEIVATEAGTYTLTFALPDTTKFTWAGTTSTADRTLTFTINPEDMIEVPLPEWDDAFGGGSDALSVTYDGTNAVVVSVKSGLNYVISAVSGGATFNGNEVTVNKVGQFTITLKLENVKKYVWEGGESGTKTLTLFVTGAEAEEMAVPEWKDGGTALKGFTYSASTSQTVEIKPLGAGVEILSVSSGVSQSGNVFTAKGSPTSTVTYTITFKLVNTTDYKWSDGTVGNKTLKFAIIGGKTVVDMPEDETETYTGSPLTFSAPANSAVSIVSVSNGATFSGKTVTATEAGSYVVTLRLTDTASESFIWANNSTADIKWTITVEKAEVDTSGFELDVYDGMYDGKSHPASVKGLPDYVTAVYTYTNAAGNTITASDIKNVGEYTVSVRFTVTDTNHKSISTTLSGTIKIAKAVLSVQWTGQTEYNYDHGNAVNLKAEVFGVADGESAPYTILLDGASADAGKNIGDYTAVVKLNTGVTNYTFAGGATQVTYAYSIANLSTAIESIAVTLNVTNSTDISVSNTDALDVVKTYITSVIATYDNGATKTLTATDYTISGDFGAATPYFKVCYGGAESDEFEVTVPVVIALSSIRVEEVTGVTTSMTIAELKALLEVTATYDNGDTKALDASAIKLLENGTELADTAKLTEGKHTITVSYTQGTITKTDTVEITVEGVKLKDISASIAAGTKIYATTTEAEIKAALTVTATYTDGSTATVGDYTIDPVTFTAGDPYTITIYYNGETATISGTVEATAITSVTAAWLNGTQAASGIPPVYAYSNIEDIRDYIEVKANGTDVVTGYLISGTLVADSECTLTVTYANQTATIKVNVLATPSTVSFKEVKVTVNQGSTVIYTSTNLQSIKSVLTVEEIWLDGTDEISKTVTDYTISGTLSAGACTLSVNFTGSDGNAKTKTFTVNVTAVEIDTITVAWNGGSQPTVYNDLTLAELQGLITVTAAYNDGTPYNGGNAIAASGYTLSGDLSAGKAEITVTVAGKSSTFEVNVTAVTLTGLSVSWKSGSQGTNKIYTSTNPDDLKSLIVVKAIYNNNAAGVELNANEYAISATFALGNNNNPVTVTYNGISDSTFTVKVEGSELTGIVASYTQSGTLYSSNSLDDIYTKGTLSVTAKFSGGAADLTLAKGDYTLTGDLTKGACTVTVTYNGKTATFTVNVTEVALVSISVSFDKNAAGNVYTTADIQTLKQYLTVTAVYGDTSEKTVTAESYTLSGSLADGELTVTYNGKTATFEVTAVAVALDGISASYEDIHTVYATTGLDELRKYLTVTAVYNDKSQAEITDYVLSGKFTADKTCTITVTYNGKTATFDVTVTDKTVVSISATLASGYTVYPYTDIEELRDYLTVTATFNYGSPEPVTEYELSGDLKTPDAQITVTYGGKEYKLTVNVTAPATADPLELSAAWKNGSQGNLKIYAGASKDDLKGYITVTATYGTQHKEVQAEAYTLSGDLTTAGVKTITVTYNDGNETKTATFTVEVSAIELVNITAEFTQSGNVSNSAQLEDLTALVVTAHYTDGTGRTLNASEYALSGDLVAGNTCEITVTYNGATAKFNVTVDATPVTFTLSASFNAAAFGNIYTSTSVEALRSQLTVTATYSDGEVKDVTGYGFVTATLTAGNSVAVTVSYQGVTAAFNVNVLALQIESIVASFNAEQIFTSTSVSDLWQYLTVSGVYNDGAAFGNITLTASNNEITGTLKAGKSVMTVTILTGDGAGKSATFEVDVTGVKVEELEVTFNKGTDKIFSTANINDLKKYFTVVAVYNNGDRKTLTAEDYTLAGTLIANSNCEITVSYNGAEKTQEVPVEGKVLSRIEVSYAQSGTLYSYNTLDDVLTNGTLTVTAYYDDSTYETVTSGYVLSGTLTSGNCLVTVNYGGKSDTFEAAVSAVTLLNIKVTIDGSAPQFYITTTIAAVKQYLTVTANYSDGNSKELAAEEYTLPTELTAGSFRLTATYEGKSDSITVNVMAVVLEGIAVEAENLPAIFANANINDLKPYLTVSATYTDGKIINVTDYTLSMDGGLVAGETCTVTVTHGGQTTSFDIKVEAKQLDYIAASYLGAAVSADTALTDLSVSVTAYYTDGTSAIVSEGYTLSGTLVAGNNCTVTVTYGDKSANISVSVDNSVTLQGITATLVGNATIYTSTSLANLKSVLKVEEVYSDGTTTTKKTVPASGYTLSGSLATAGARTITVTLVSDTTKTTTIVINVAAVELQSITATFDKDGAGEIFVDATLNDLKAYLAVSGVNNDGSEIATISGYTLSGEIAIGECEITVEYLGKTTTFLITVSNKSSGGATYTLKEITATANIPATVTVYPDADAEDIRQYLTVTAVYTNGNASQDVSQIVTSYTFVTSKVTLSGGNYVLTVEFDGEQADAIITVTPVTLAQINADFKQSGTVFTSANVNDLKAFLTVTGTNNDGSAYNGGAQIADNDYTLSGELSAGKAEITVMYQGFAATFTVNVTAVTINSPLTVTVDETRLPVIYTTTNLNDLKQYLTVTAYYSDDLTLSNPKTIPAADYTLSGDLLAGRTCTVTVSYNGVEGTFEVEVASSVLTAITVQYDKDGNAPEVFSSTPLDDLKAYLYVEAQFSIGAPEEVTSGYTLTGDLTKGACQITVHYNGKTATFTVNVTEVALVTLEAVYDKDGNAPEVFESTSLESLRSYVTVTANYSDGGQREITEYTFPAGLTLQEGANTVTVTYVDSEGKNRTATFTLNVTGVKLDGIVAVFDKANAPKIFHNTTLNDLKQWLTVTASYTDNKLAAVYDYTLSMDGAFEAGKTCTVTVSYGGKTATFDVTVEKKSIASITANYGGSNTVDNTVTLDDIKQLVTVDVTYDDGSTESNVTGFTLSGTIAAGPVTVTVSYGGQEDYINLTVTATYTLNKITAEFVQGNTRIYAGKTPLNSLKNMLTVTAHYVDSLGYSVDSKVIGDADYSFVGGNLNTAGTKTLTVNYNGKTATFTVEVTVVDLDSLTAVFDTSFNVTASTPLNSGANSIAAHLTVTGTNNDGSAYNGGSPITNFTVSGDLKAGQVCPLTVTVDHKSVTFYVSVAADVTLTSIDVRFDQTALSDTVYTSSDLEMLVAGITVTAHYSNGTTRVIEYPNYTFVCDIKNNGDGNATIYVSYDSYSVAQNVAATGLVAVTAVKVSSISANFSQNGEPIYNSDTLTDVQALLASGKVSLSVVGVNNDGTFENSLTGYTLTNFNATNGEVTVDYNGITTTFSVIVIGNNLNGLRVSLDSGYTLADIDIYTSQSTDKLKDYIKVEAFFTGDGWQTVADSDYTLAWTETSRDADKIVYTVTVNYFTESDTFGYPVEIKFVKLTSATVTLNSAYKTDNIVIYDSMSAADAAALVENYLTITGYYNDGSNDTLALAAFLASGDLSILNSFNEATVTLTYATDSAISGSFDVEVTKVAFSHIEIDYFRQPNTAKVYASQTIADLQAMFAAYDLELDVTAHFNNGSSRALSFSDIGLTVSADPGELNPDNTLKVGTRTIKITYTHGGISDTKTVEVKVEPVDVKSLTATLNGNTVYTTTTVEEFYKMITVTAVYNNNDVANPDSTTYTTDLPATLTDKPFLAEAGNSFTVEISYGSQTYNLTFTVAKAVVTIDTTGIGAYTFGDNEISGVQTIDSGAKLMLGTSEVTDTTVSLVYSNNTFTNCNDANIVGGKITITISFAGDSVYAAYSTTCQVTVNKATVDLSTFDFLFDGTAYDGTTNKTYDGAAHTLDLGTTFPTGISSISQYVYKYTKINDTVETTITSSDIKNAGTYKVTASLVYDANHTGDATVSITFVINKAQAVVSYTGGSTFTYNGQVQSVTGATLTTGDQTIYYKVGTSPASTAGFSFTNVNDGNGKAVTIYVNENDNFLAHSITVNLIVKKAELTVTAKPHTIEYGDAPANDGITVTGLQHNDTLTTLGVTESYTYDYVGTGGIIGDVGNYNISVTLQGGDLSNYNVTYVKGTLTVTEKEVNVDWTKTDVTYDGSAHIPEATFTDIYGHVVILTVKLSDTPNGTLTANEAIDAGTYAATITTTNKNYTFSAATKDYEFVIKPAKVIVTKSGNTWYLRSDLFDDRDALIELDMLDNTNTNYEYIHIVGDQTAAITIEFSTAFEKGTEPGYNNAGVYTAAKPQNVTSAGSYVVYYRITVANHETYHGEWSIDILDDTDPAAKFIQIIFTKPYVFEYGTLPEPTDTAALAALAEKLYDEGYIDNSKLKFTKEQFLAHVNLVLRADNDNKADNDTGYGSYSIYFEWKSTSQFAADWVIAYKEGVGASDSNVGKLQITKKQLTATWSETSFIADGKIHLPTLTISGFNDGSTYELELTSAESGTYTIVKDGKTLNLSVKINGNLTAAGATVITLSLDNENFDIEGDVTAISISAPTVITVTWDSTSFVSNGTVHLPTATISDGTNTATLAITREMAANGGGTAEITLGGVTITVKVTITGTGSLLNDIGKYTVTLSIDDNRYTLPAGSATISVDAPAAVSQEEGLSPLMLGIIIAVAVLALLIIIVIIVVIKRKPSTVRIGSDDGFDDNYADED